MKKICTICEMELPLSDFYNKKSGSNGKQSECKKCNINRVKKYYTENKNSIILKKKEYNKANKQKRSRQIKEYYNNNRDAILVNKKVYREANKSKIRERVRKYEKKKSQDPVYRAIRNCRNRIAKICRGVDLTKSKSKYLGCSAEEYKIYIQSQFKDGMNWENYGLVWHVDHKKPVSLFDLSNESEMALAFHYSNTQPLFAKDNIIKSNKRIDV